MPDDVGGYAKLVLATTDLKGVYALLGEAPRGPGPRSGSIGYAFLELSERRLEAAPPPPPLVATVEAGNSGADAPPKPPAQTIAPAGAAPGLVSGAGIAPDINRELFELCNSPWFQQYCRSTTKSDITDDLKLAVGVVKMLLLEGGKTWGENSMAKLVELKAAYHAWCEAKGYRN